MFPPETKVVAHQLSPRALYYMPEDALVHRFIIAGERPRQQKDEDANATKQLREMISDAELTSITVETGTGAIRSVETHTRGPIAFVESASGSQINPEDLNRCVIFPIDESQEQTNRVCRAQASAAAGETPDLSDEIVPVHHALQRSLQPRRVVIPFAHLLADRFPKNRIEARRALGHVYNIIRAIALLRQCLKANGDGDLVADPEDYSIALPLLGPTLDRLCGRLDAQSRRTWQQICEQLHYVPGVGDPPPAQELDRTLVACWTGINERVAGERLRILGNAGYLILAQEHRGRVKALWKVNPHHLICGAAEELGLPSVDEVRAHGTDDV